MPAAIPSSLQWSDVRVALTSGVTDPTTVNNGEALDGVTLATGNRFVCVGARPDAGIYTVGASSSVRADDANEAAEFQLNRRVRVTEGSNDNRGTWILLTPGAITLGTTVLTISQLRAEDIEIPDIAYTDQPAIPISMASSTSIYYGISAQATLTEGQAKADLLSVTRTAPAGTYVCAATGYKFLLVPASQTPPAAIRDLATGFAISLAGVEQGYGNTTSGLSHASLAIDGVNYRVYRSAAQLGAALTLQVL